jgi:HD-GYP domain-containing protein (c-di-GMP phosphodiesterase class II)
MGKNEKIIPIWNEVPEWAHTIAETLLQALKERDPYTFQHSQRVAENAKRLAEAAGLNIFQQQVIAFASMFHDIGKIGIPDKVLFKPDRLTTDEEAIMRSHPLKSADILAPLCHIPFFRAVVPGVKAHHERFDGSGYADGLDGNRIPIAARVILIADTFDAMTSTRPYRNGLSAETAYREIITCSGKQFDPLLAAVFVKAHPEWIRSQNVSAEEAGTRKAA